MEGVVQLDIEVGKCEHDMHIQEVILRAVQMVEFADPHPQQMEPIITFMQGKDVFVSLPTAWIRQIANIFSARAAICVRRIA